MYGKIKLKLGCTEWTWAVNSAFCKLFSIIYGITVDICRLFPVLMTPIFFLFKNIILNLL